MRVRVKNLQRGKQYYSRRNRARAQENFKIEDAWKTLERAYGPIYSLLNGNKYEQTGKVILDIMEIDEKDKNNMDQIMIIYPFLFTDEINKYWRKNIFKSELKYTKGSLHRPIFYIHVKFRDMINKEYEKKVKEHNKLLKQ